jgi:adenosylhomocysteine nucleosidase
MTVEMRPLVKALELEGDRVGGRKVHRGSVGGTDVVATLAGVGMTPAREATEYLIERFQPTFIVLSGIAGGIDAEVDVGDLIVPEVVVDYATSEEYVATAFGGVVPKGRLITGDGLIDTPLLMEENRKGTTAVDMETAAMAAVCSRHGVPWLAFRAISDVVRDGLVDDSTMMTLKPDGSIDVKGVVKLIATHPKVVPNLMRLGRDTNVATRVAAEAAAAACRASQG